LVDRRLLLPWEYPNLAKRSYLKFTLSEELKSAQPEESYLPDMTKFWHAGHQIEIREVGNMAQELVAWEYIVDGLHSTRTYSTEKDATGAAIELAERLPAVI
jgi:hypothetical protein